MLPDSIRHLLLEYPVLLAAFVGTALFVSALQDYSYNAFFAVAQLLFGSLGIAVIGYQSYEQPWQFAGIFVVAALYAWAVIYALNRRARSKKSAENKNPQP